MQGALLQVVRNYASKDVRFGIECREAVLAGVNKLADAVQVTLGPKVSETAGHTGSGAGAPLTATATHMHAAADHHPNSCRHNHTWLLVCQWDYFGGWGASLNIRKGAGSVKDIPWFAVVQLPHSSLSCGAPRCRYAADHQPNVYMHS